MTKCAWCGAEFSRSHSRGRVPRYCRSSCRQRAYEWRRAKQKDAEPAAEERKGYGGLIDLAAPRRATFGEIISRAAEALADSGLNDGRPDYQKAYERLVDDFRKALAVPDVTPDGRSTVLIADDSGVLRNILRTELELQSELIVIAEARDGREAVDKAIELVPDVVIMDLRMPGLDGITATREIHKQLPSIRVLILTVSDEESDLFDAIRAGATGYILKDSLDTVSDVVRTISEGHWTISPTMAPLLLRDLELAADAPGDNIRLSSRERQVLTLIATRAMTNREIADELGLSVNTVKNHVANILVKLHLRNRVDIASFALRR